MPGLLPPTKDQLDRWADAKYDEAVALEVLDQLETLRKDANHLKDYAYEGHMKAAIVVWEGNKSKATNKLQDMWWGEGFHLWEVIPVYGTFDQYYAEKYSKDDVNDRANELIDTIKDEITDLMVPPRREPMRIQYKSALENNGDAPQEMASASNQYPVATNVSLAVDSFLSLPANVQKAVQTFFSR